MRKQLTVALGLAVLATPAFASKARLQALGEDVNGSYYVNDNRNIWLNPAAVNAHKDLVTYEFGDTTQATDATATPRAEGGVFKTMGSMVYGVQFGGASNTANAFRSALGLTGANEKNNLSLFVGGDAGVKWGLGVDYANAWRDHAAAKTQALPQAKGAGEVPLSESMRLRLGAQAGDLGAYAILNAISRATDVAGNEYQGRSGYQFGATYNMNGNTFFAEYAHLMAVTTPATESQSERQLRTNSYKLGVARSTRLNDKATLFAKAYWNYAEAFNTVGGDYLGTAGSGTVCNASAAVLCANFETYSIPVVVGAEFDATSWLALRASVAQTVWGWEQAHKLRRGFVNTTVVNAGASLKFGELSVDGVVGNMSDNNLAAVGTNTSTGKGTLRTDQLMSRVSMTYRF